MKHILGGFSNYDGEIPGNCTNAVTASYAKGCKECKDRGKDGNKGW